MSTSVKHIHSGMRGAPQINGNTPGCMIAVLAALFETGWGETTAVSVNVSGGIATATLTSGHNFGLNSVILVDGGTPSALNGENRVSATSPTSTSWPTTAPDGAATGTITIKYAPQTAWKKPYAKTNVAVYQSTFVTSKQHFLRVDDTGTIHARVRGYEAMSDVDTGTGPFPTDTLMSGGGYWWKSAATNTNAVKYRIFCNEWFVLVAIAPGSHNSTTALVTPLRGFGDSNALAPGGDAWCTLLSANGTNSSQVEDGSFASSRGSSTNGFTACPRAVSGLGGAVYLNPAPWTGNSSSTSGDDLTLGYIVSEVDGKVRPSKMFAKEQATGKPPRVEIPGVLYLPHKSVYGTLRDGDVLDGAGELAGRRLMVIPAGTTFGAPSGAYLVDMTGPW